MEKLLFTKLLSPTDTSKCLEIPTGNPGDFEFPTGQHAINIEATDTSEQQWTFRLSSIRRNDNSNPRLVFTGQWIQFVKEKDLKVGDKIVFSRQQPEGDGVQYRIRVERKLFKCWVNIQ